MGMEGRGGEGVGPRRDSRGEDGKSKKKKKKENHTGQVH